MSNKTYEMLHSYFPNAAAQNINFNDEDKKKKKSLKKANLMVYLAELERKRNHKDI